MLTPQVTPGQLVAERFRILRRLGAGGMGAVYEAEQLDLGRPVAIKLLNAGTAASAEQVGRFEREARAAARLAHPNVVGVTELTSDPQLGPVLVMELLQGTSLAARIDTHGPLSAREAVGIFEQALDGLAAAHVAGMVHRDLKPSNIFLVPLSAGTLVKVLDFGIVKLAEEGAHRKLTQQGTILGTPAYMSPEQVDGHSVDLRTDVYALGACLYETLTGVPPYHADTSMEIVMAVHRGPPRDVADVASVVPGLAAVVRRAMARDPLARYPSALAMMDALRSADLTASVPLRATRSDRDPRATSVDARTVATPPPSMALTSLRLPIARGSRRALLVFAVLAALGLIVAFVVAASGTHQANASRIVRPVLGSPRAPRAPGVSLPLPTDEPQPIAVPIVLPRGVDPPSLPDDAGPTARLRHVRPPAAPPTPPPGHAGEDVIDPF